MTRRPLIHLALLAALLTAVPLAHAASSLPEVFATANEQFWAGRYAEARAGYQRLLDLGASDPVILHNLATAEARLGELGRAVWHYEQALRRDPGLETSARNLLILREHLARRANEAGRDADLAPATNAWRAVLDRFTGDGAAVILLLLDLLLFGLILARRFSGAESLRLGLGVAAGVFALATALALAVALGRWHLERHVAEAVVIASGASEAREGPGSDVKRFTVEEGSRVRVREERDGFVRIEDGAGRDGWLSARSLGRL